MTPQWLVAAGLTFAASIHCVGMCGGFVLAVAAGRRGAWPLVAHQLQLQLGKAASYAFLGALAGAFGSAALASPLFAWGERVLAVAAALALAAAGISLLGLRGGEGRVASWLAPAWSKVTGPLLVQRPAGFPLVVGLAMGLLPCPLVYAGLAAAAASGSPAAGAATLAGVALGTIPALAVVAASGTALTLGARRALARVAGVVLIAAAAVTVARVAGPHAGHSSHAGPHPAAPAASPVSTPDASAPLADPNAHHRGH
jgi:sulfite exporter TauE/SafE